MGEGLFDFGEKLRRGFVKSWEGDFNFGQNLIAGHIFVFIKTFNLKINDILVTLNHVYL